MMHRSGGFDLVLISTAALTAITFVGGIGIAIQVSGLESRRAQATQAAE